MKTASELKGSRLKAEVTLNHIRFPRSHEPGEFAIAYFDVSKVLDGEIPSEFRVDGGALGLDLFSICAKGNMPTLERGNKYILQGKLEIDPKWGPQYQTEQVRLDFNLTNREDQRAFFKKFLTANQVDLLMEGSDNPVKWLEDHDLEKLMTIKGVGPVVAERLIRKYEDCKDYGRAYVELEGLDITRAAIEKMTKRYGSVDVVVEKIKKNPYVLIREVQGYGWEKADAIAMQQGLRTDSKERVVAFMEYYLRKEAEDNGNSWISIDVLLPEISAVCYPVTKENLFAYVKENMGGDDVFKKLAKLSKADRLKLDNVPLTYYDSRNRRVGLMSIRLLEFDIAKNLKRLHDADNPFLCSEEDISKAILQAEKEQGFTYSLEQVNAIMMVLKNNVSIITGSPGTGKTSMLNAVTKLFRDKGLKIEQCALSGRASSKMTEVTGIQGKTIHRLLNYRPDEEGFTYHEGNPIPADVIILDEASMVGGELFLSLISAIDDRTKFIMVGDHHQLEAIGLANVLKDCLNSGGYIPASILMKIHRQAAKSGIITQSIRASSGENLVSNTFVGEEVRGELQDFKIVCGADSTTTQYNIVKEYRRFLAMGIKKEDIQVIVPTRVRGNISCRAINEILQEIVNPGDNPGAVTVPYTDGGIRYEVTYKKGDRIIVMKNNYRAVTPQGKRVAIYNGNVGYIAEIDSEHMVVDLTEQGKVVIFRDDWSNINLSYAITCHKKQGDQVPYAIVGIDSSSYAMYSKEWVYTAITRASKYCTLVTNAATINRAVKISRVKQKQTWLKEYLSELYRRSVKAGEGA